MGGVDQFNKNRALQLEEMKANNLNKIARERNKLMGDELGLMSKRLEGQATDRTALAAERLSAKQDAAIQGVQERIDGVMKPGDMEMAEYIRGREAVMKNSADMDAQELQSQLNMLEQAYLDRQQEGLDPTTEAGKRAIADSKKYVNRINSVVETGNRKLKRTFGDSFKGSVVDYVYLEGGADRLRAQEGEAGADTGEVVDDRVVPPVVEEGGGGGFMEALGDPTSAITSIGDSLRGYPAPTAPNPGSADAKAMGFDRGVRITPEDAQYYDPATGKINRPKAYSPLDDGYDPRGETEAYLKPESGLMGVSEIRRDLRIDPNTGAIITPGAGLPDR